MTYVIALLCLIILACAVTLYRAYRENEDLHAALVERDVRLHYLGCRNAELGGELLTMSRRYGMPPNTSTASTAVLAELPKDHPQKRKPKSIRGKKK